MKMANEIISMIKLKPMLRSFKTGSVWTKTTLSSEVSFTLIALALASFRSLYASDERITQAKMANWTNVAATKPRQRVSQISEPFACAVSSMMLQCKIKVDKQTSWMMARTAMAWIFMTMGNQEITTNNNGIISNFDLKCQDGVEVICDVKRKQLYVPLLVLDVHWLVCTFFS